MRTSVLLFSLLAFGCDSGAGPVDSGDLIGDGGSDAGPSTPLPATLGPADRPAALFVPGAHDGVTALPLVVLLHGYSASGTIQDTYFGLSRETTRRGFYAIVADGTQNSVGDRFWNATPACCNFDGSTVDDVGYLIGLVDELEALAPVSDVFFMGHSNGGFMSYRMACEHADRISAFVSLAGGDFATETDCVPSQPVSMLQIHGTVDPTIAYDGAADGSFPSAPDAVRRWAARAGCVDIAVSGESLDIDTVLIGTETSVDRYTDGCVGAQAELWTIAGGGHIPTLGRSFMPTVLEWFSAHAR